MLTSFKELSRKKIFIAASFSLLCLSQFTPAYANCSTNCNKWYIGAFAGGGYTNSVTMNQRGTAFFADADGGPLDVNATGSSSRKSFALGGIHLGYEWNRLFCFNNSQWNLTPAAEIEGFYHQYTLNGALLNPTPRLPGHTFQVSLPTRTGVFLLNSIWNINIPCTCVQPYVGVGVGAATVRVSGADSDQTVPLEPGVNHFNSSTNSSTWTFAAQAKAGLRFMIWDNVRLFAEYRYLYLSPSNQTFGSTQYPTHVATTNWNVRVNSMHENIGTVGIDYAINWL